MKRVRLIPALALVLSAALFLTACGGDDSPEVPIVIPTETTSSLDKTEFIEEADAICEEANAAIGVFVSSGEGFTSSGEIADLRQSVIDDISSLGPPADDQQTLDSFLAGFQAQVDAGQKIALANERGSDTAQFEAELDSAQAETLTAGEAYGFTECGQEASATDSTATTDSGASSGTSVAPAPVAPDTTGGGVGDTGGDTGDTGGTGGTGGGVSPP